MPPVANKDPSSEARAGTGREPTEATIRELAQDAAYRLLQGGPGALLIGSPGRTGAVIRGVLELLQGRLGDRLQPVRLQAAAATPGDLRDVVEKAHVALAEPRSWLLLVMPDIDHASPALLRELELAAEAAAQHGGLQFLFGSGRDLDALLRRAQLPALAAALTDRFALPPEIGSALLPTEPLAAPLDRLQPDAPPRGIMLRIVVALLAVAAVAALVIYGIVTHAGPQVPVPKSVPPPPPAATATAPAIPATPSPPPQPPLPPATPVQRPPAPTEPPAAVESSPETFVPMPPLPPPAASLLLQAQAGDSLASLSARVYRGLVPPAWADIVAANPEPIRPGARVVFPAPPTGWGGGSAPGR